MNAELKSKWIAALRSGDYVQGRTSLRKDGKFCCLGVACDLLDPTKWSSEPTKWGDYEYRGDTTIWPWFVSDKFGVSMAQSDQLWNMNDRGDSFSEIADYIEQNL